MSDLEREIQQIQALLTVQIADQAAMLHILKEIQSQLEKLGCAPADVYASFLRERKRLLHRSLETLETSNPALAARMQEAIDTACTIHPFGYD